MHKPCKWRDHVVSALSVAAWLCVSNWVQVEQRVEPAKKAAQVLHKKLQGCMQSQQGLDAEKRMVLKVLSLMSFWLAAFGCYICFCLHRKSSPWCCCPSAWRRASKTLMQSPLSGDRFDALQSIHPSIHLFMLLTWQLTTDCSHVKNLMTVVRWLSVLDEKERGSHSLSKTCDRCH